MLVRLALPGETMGTKVFVDSLSIFVETRHTESGKLKKLFPFSTRRLSNFSTVVDLLGKTANLRGLKIFYCGKNYPLKTPDT